MALLPAFNVAKYKHKSGSKRMSRLAAHMVGGMISTALQTLLVLSAIYLPWKQRNLRKPEP